MKLINALERRADRGPRQSPYAVIANARQAVDGGRTRRSAAVAGHGDGMRRPSFAWRTAMLGTAFAATAGIAWAVAARGPTSETVSPAGSTAETPAPAPQGPLSISEARRAELTGRCQHPSGDIMPTSDPSVLVDARPDGELVVRTAGLGTDPGWSCLLIDGTLHQSGPPFLPPAGLYPDPTAAVPLVVLDAKAPDGNLVDGNEATYVIGRLHSSVARITITTPTGSYEPTVQDGWFAAWWPGNDGDATVVHAFDAAGNEIAFVDQLNCSTAEPVEIGGSLYTPTTPRLVVGGDYVSGGCRGGADVPAGTTDTEIGD